MFAEGTVSVGQNVGGMCCRSLTLWPYSLIHWVFPKGVYTPKWMVYLVENPIKMDDLGGYPPIFGNIHMD